jgi:hypothetical protein
VDDAVVVNVLEPLLPLPSSPLEHAASMATKEKTHEAPVIRMRPI